jgi:hypothetical protein
MKISAQKDSSQSDTEPKREGLVVWDQKGLVVLWPDGHCSRFPWAALRQACPCAECHRQWEAQQAEPEGPSASWEVVCLPPPVTSLKGART